MMDWTSIIVACVSALGAGGGSLYGIRKSSCLTDGFAQKIPVIEERLKVINHRLEDLENKLKS